LPLASTDFSTEYGVWVLLLAYLPVVCRTARQLPNPLLMRLPVRGGGCCYSPVPSPTEPLGHGDFGPGGSAFFPPNHFTKPTDVSQIACSIAPFFITPAAS